MGQGYGYSEQDTVSDIKKLIDAVDLMDEAVSNRAASAMRSAAEIIVREQRNLISSRSSKLPELIKAGKLKVNKNGKFNIPCGYDSDAIKEAFEGLIMEFGRPGKSSSDGTDKNGKKIGKVEPTPHIFRGLDNAADEATQHVFDSLLEVIKW